MCIVVNIVFAFRSKASKTTLQKIKKSCDKFMIEVISSLCFGQQSPPEDDLIENLLKFIFDAEAESTPSTSQLTFYEDKRDETPVIRSFLLQLLLGHK